MPRCLNCKDKFIPKRFLEKFCEKEECVNASVKYAIEKVRENNAKKWKAEKAVLKEKLKTKSDYEKELQKEINTIVRLIDKNFFCISTRKHLNDKKDAGHYFSTSSNPALRFNLFNIYAQSVYANQYLSGDLINFLDGLRHFYGDKHAEYVLSLKSRFKALKLSQEELKEKTSIARSIVKWLKLQDKTYDASERIELRKKYNDELGIYKNEF